MYKKGVFCVSRVKHRILAGISALAMSLTALPLQTLTVSAYDASGSIFEGDVYTYMQALYETTTYPQVAISEGIKISVTDPNGRLFGEVSTLPEYETIYSGVGKYDLGYTFWLDQVYGYKPSDYAKFVGQIAAGKSEILDITGSLGASRARMKNGVPYNMPSGLNAFGMYESVEDVTEVTALYSSDLNNATLYDLYCAYAYYMYEADKRMMEYNVPDISNKIKALANSAGTGLTTSAKNTRVDRAAFDNYYSACVSGVNASACTEAGLIKSMLSGYSTSGYLKYLTALQQLQFYMEKTTATSGTYGDYLAYLNKMELLDGTHMRTAHMVNMFTALSTMTTHLLSSTDLWTDTSALENSGVPFFTDSGAKDLFEILDMYKKAYAIIGAIADKNNELATFMYRDSVNTDAIWAMCTQFVDFRQVYSTVVAYNPPTAAEWDAIWATVKTENGSGGLHEVTPFFGITDIRRAGSYWQSHGGVSQYANDAFRSADKRDSGQYNVGSLANGTIRAANGGDASALQKILSDNELESINVKKDDIVYKIYVQDADNKVPVCRTDAGDGTIDNLGQSLKAQGKLNSYGSINFPGNLYNLIYDDVEGYAVTIDPDYASSLGSYLSTLAGSTTIKNGSNSFVNAATALNLATRNASRKCYNYTGETKFLFEIAHYYSATGELKEEEDVVFEDGASSSVANGSFTPYIPEYSLAEYYNGIADIPSSQELATALSREDGDSYNHLVTTYLNKWKTSSKTGKNEPSKIALDVKIEPLWVNVMNPVTTNKTYNKSWKSATTAEGKFTAYSVMPNYTGSKHEDANTNHTYRVVNGDAQFEAGETYHSDATPLSDPTKDPTVMKDTKTVYAVAAQAYGRMNGTGGTPYYKAVQRLLYPIVQYTNDQTGGADLNLHTQVDGGSEHSQANKGFDVFVTNETVPELTWNFTNKGSIINQKSDDKDKTFKLDYHMWVARTTATDGIVIADWVNPTPTLLQGLIMDSASVSVPTTPDGLAGASQYQPYKLDSSGNAGDYELDHHNIKLLNSSVTANYSDWTIGKKINQTTLLWCAEWGMLVPRENLSDHMYIYYNVDGEGKEWTATSEDFEESFKYVWQAPSWQSDIELINRSSGAYTVLADYKGGTGDAYDVGAHYGQQPDWKDYNGDGEVSGTIEPIDDGAQVYVTGNGAGYTSSSMDAREGLEGNEGTQTNRNNLYALWYRELQHCGAFGQGVGDQGSVTNNMGTGQTFVWEFGWAMPEGGEYTLSPDWILGALREAGLLENADDGTEVATQELADAMKRRQGTYPTYLSGGGGTGTAMEKDSLLHFSIGSWKPVTCGSSKLTKKWYMGDREAIFYCDEVQVAIPLRDVPPPEGDYDTPVKSTNCDHTTITVQDVINVGSSTTFVSHTAYSGDCKLNADIQNADESDDEKLIITEKGLTDTSGGSDDSTSSTPSWSGSESASDTGSSGFTVTYYYADPEEGEDIEYHSEEQIQVCFDKHDETLVYFTMTLGGAFGSESTNYEEPKVTYDTDHEGSKRNPIENYIKAQAMYSTGDGETSEPSAMSDKHPESLLKDKAQEYEDSIVKQEGTCEGTITTCRTGEHTVTCDCDHLAIKRLDDECEEHFYEEGAEGLEGDVQNHYISEYECLLGRAFTRWAIVGPDGNELKNEDEIRECLLKKTDPTKWAKFDNPDKVSALLKDKSNKFRAVPDPGSITTPPTPGAETNDSVLSSTFCGAKIKSNTNVGIVDGENKEWMTKAEYTGDVSYKDYSYDPVVVRKVVTTDERGSTVYPGEDGLKFDFTYKDSGASLVTLTANPEGIDVFGNDLDEGKWQSDRTYADNTYWYGVVPEVLMTYKTGVTETKPPFPTSGGLTDEQEKTAGKIGSAYVAGYNKYDMYFPVYNKISLDAGGSKSTTVSSQVASDAQANTLKGKFENGAEVFYNGAEINTSTALKSSTGGAATIEFTSYVLDFKDAQSALKSRWGGNGDALTYANSWLNLFKTSDDATNFVARAGTYVTFGDTSGKTYKQRSEAPGTTMDKAPSVDGKEHKRLSNYQTVEFGNAGNTKYTAETEHYDIEIRNGRLARVTVGGTNYNLYDTNIMSSQALAEAMKNGSASYGGKALYDNPNTRDVAEAIVNMKLVEFAKTLANDADEKRNGTETWTQYNTTSLYTSTDGTNTVGDEVNQMKQTGNGTVGGGQESFSAGVGGTKWYAEDSTVLTIRKYTTGAINLPEMVVATNKLPIDYGYKPSSDKSSRFSKGVQAFAEFSLELTGSADETIAIDGVNDKLKVTGKGSDSNVMYTYAAWDIIGDELIGKSRTYRIDPELQFILSDASVNDMY